MPSTLPSKFQLILTDAFNFFVHNFRQIATLCLPFLFAAAMVQLLLMEAYPDSDISLFASMAANLLVYPIYTAALIQLMARRARNEQPKNSELILASLPQWGALLTLKLLTTLLLFFGFSMFIVPGVWLWVRIVFAEFYLVLFNAQPVKALEKSVAVTKGHFAPILLLLLVTYPPILLGFVIFDEFIQSVTANLFLRIIAVTSGSLIAQFANVIFFRAFMEVVKEQPDTVTD